MCAAQSWHEGSAALRKIDAAKSGRQWAKDIGTSILVNVLTVIVVGVIALGSREYSSLTSAIEARVSAEQK